MAIGGAFLGGGVEVVPAGSCKLELEILTEDRANLTATFTIKGTSTYTVTAGADGRAVYTVPSGQTYTVSVNTTGYDNLTSQTVVAESGTVRYVRFEAFAGRVKRSGDTMTGNLGITKLNPCINLVNTEYNVTTKPSSTVFSDIQFFDSTLTRVALLEHYKSDNNRKQLALILNSSETAGVENWGFMGLANDGYGTYGFAPNWSIGTNDNSDKVLTIAMANGLPSLVHTDRDEQINGVKTFLANPIIKSNLTLRWKGPPTVENINENITKNFAGFTTVGNFLAKATDGEIGGVKVFRSTPGGYAASITNLIANNAGGTEAIISVVARDDGIMYAQAPTTNAGAIGNEIATANWSIGKFVQKTGDTMTGGLSFRSPNQIGQYIDNQTLDKTVAPSSATTIWYVQTRDKNYQPFGNAIAHGMEADGRVWWTFGQNATTWSGLTVIKPLSGNPYVNSISWSVGTNDNSDKVLTIKMANSLPSLVHTTGNETIAGEKKFSSNVTIYRWNGGFVASSSSVELPTADNGYVSKGNDYEMMYFTTTDKNGKTVASLRGSYKADLVSRASLYAYNTNSKGANIYSNLVLEAHQDGTTLAKAPTTPTNATSNEIATANWVNTKLAERNKVTNVTSYAQLMDLIKNGKRGDSFGITMDYVGGSIGGITAYDREVHAFGHYTIDEITVSGGALTGLQAFGSGEVSGKLKDNDNTTYTYATTGFGRQAIGNGVLDALRVVEDGKLTYFAPNDNASISAFEGYYISI